MGLFLRLFFVLVVLFGVVDMVCVKGRGFVTAWGGA